MNSAPKYVLLDCVGVTTRCRISLAGLMCILLACAAQKPAPVTEHVMHKPSTNTLATDWRPATYTVKKGDTLIKIGLEFGYDYKDIAGLNNIQPPYKIYTGQVLRLGDTTPQVSATKSTAPVSNQADVVVSPLKQDIPVGMAPVRLLTEPKAKRRVYLASTPEPVLSSQSSDNTSTSNKPSETLDSANKPIAPSSGIDWLWPAQGKVIAAFNETTNKGIDIGGALGQAIYAAAPGKVIYSGGDLRVYGQLLIIKHDAIFISIYAYNNLLLVKEGQTVTRGQKIAEMGSRDKTPRLHFEIRRQGKSVNPLLFLPAPPQ